MPEIPGSADTDCICKIVNDDAGVVLFWYEYVAENTLIQSTGRAICWQYK